MQPTIAIYQNPDHVAGILQQLHVTPLVTAESRETGQGDQPIKIAESLPPGGEILAAVDTGESTNANLAALSPQSALTGFGSGTRTVQNFTYSQAYYLFFVRETLKRNGLIRTIESASDAVGLKSGEFVEFHATFRPNALHALLDILTPELIGAIVNYRAKSEELKSYPEFGTIDELKIYSEKMFMRARMKSDIARSIAEAVRVDFRAKKTREFYASISDITAITICDVGHFVVSDEDRILDGAYKVLGKATSEIEQNLPILSRNKLLDRLGPEFVDSIFDAFLDSAASQTGNLKFGNGKEHALDDAFDLEFPSRIDGPSFKVIPIAVYV